MSVFSLDLVASTKLLLAGESAGGGSVMLQTMAYGGTLGTSLFTNVSFTPTSIGGLLMTAM